MILRTLVDSRTDHRRCAERTSPFAGQHRSHGRGRAQRKLGATLIWVASGLFLMISIVGLATDTAWVFYVAHQLQNCADSCALAGAHELRTSVSNARDQAVALGVANAAATNPVQLNRNDGNAAAGDIVVGRYDRDDGSFTPQTSSPNAVQVTARCTAASANGAVPLVFGPIAGVSTIDVSRPATAMIIGGLGAGVITLNPAVSCAFDLRGRSGDFVVDGGVIVVNSTHPDAACHSGKPTLQAEEIHVEGETDKNFEDKVNLDGSLIEESPLAPVPDPLAGVPEPVYDPANDLGAVSVTGGASELITTSGYYGGGFSVQNGTLTLGRGIYILDGPGLDITGGNFLAQDGVLIHVVGTGAVDIRGNGEIRIEAARASDPTGAGDPLLPYVGVPIFQARDNTNDSRILGTANFSIGGTLYFPSAHLEIGGTSDSFASGLIADTIQSHGNGLLQINYEGQFGVLPRIVFLVE